MITNTCLGYSKEQAQITIYYISEQHTITKRNAVLKHIFIQNSNKVHF